MKSRPDRMVFAAFLVFVVPAGATAIGVRFALREMGPFWSAAIRFALAGLLLSAYMIATRRPFPSGIGWWAVRGKHSGSRPARPRAPDAA